MNKNEYRSDLLLRYNHLHKKRHTMKQKNKFLKTLLIELYEIRSDIKVIESYMNGNRKVVSRNVYVGDVKKAKTIIATYYDTPSAYFGSYSFVNKNDQQKRTLQWNLVYSLFITMIGSLFTVFYVMPYSSHNHLSLSLNWIVIGMIYFILFMILGQTSKGIPTSNNLIRNTSSLIWLIEKIKDNSHDDVAYAFLDSGCTNNQGLMGLKQSVSKHAIIYHVDCIGSASKIRIFDDQYIEKPMNQITRGVVYIVASDDDSLDKRQLNATVLNQDNFDELNKIL